MGFAANKPAAKPIFLYIAMLAMPDSTNKPYNRGSLR